MKLLLTSAALAFTLTATLASAQTPCAPRESVIGHLSERYGESRGGAGLAANNTVVEIWVNEESGTWTIMSTNPRGVTCLIASGQAFTFQELVEQPQGELN